MDDPRNTDNAWMETEAVNYHDETGRHCCLCFLLFFYCRCCFCVRGAGVSHESGRECKLSLILKLKAMGVRVSHLLSCSFTASIGCRSPWISFSPELRNIRDLPENNLFLC